MKTVTSVHGEDYTNQSPNLMLSARYQEVRNDSLRICQPLEIEDYVVQPIADVSPPKWHLAHTTWFFEELILKKYATGYQAFNEHFPLLFNSYYKSAGKHWIQSERGQLSRPTVNEVLSYRQHVDQAMLLLLSSLETNSDIQRVTEIGLHHEQQHQELLLMDIKYILAVNPSQPAYSEKNKVTANSTSEKWIEHTEGLYSIGHQSNDGDITFSYDNETPNHSVYLQSFSVRKGLVTNTEYITFMEDGGYSKPKLWLSEGWDWINRESINSPLYWTKKNSTWYEYTLYGLKPVDPNAPVTHVSFFEAHAYASWSGNRLPTEFEFEVSELAIDKSEKISDPTVLLESLHPNNPNADWGQTWCWTNSQYLPYPGYQPFSDELFEYNSKFMCNQFVLKGGCVFTPNHHYRHSYRNFYQPHQRWMMSGIKLAK